MDSSFEPLQREPEEPEIKRSLGGDTALTTPTVGTERGVLLQIQVYVVEVTTALERE